MKKNKPNKNTKEKRPAILPDGESPPPKTASRGLWQSLQDLSASRPVFLACAILLPFFALANFTTDMALARDFDIWFHLAYGREYVQNLTWSLDHTQFSWTPAQSEWMYPWLGSALMYVVHQAAGVHGLFVLLYIILAASAGAVLWLARVSEVRADIWLLAAFLAVAHVLSISGCFVKPEMFSTLLMTLTTVFCFRFRMAPGWWIAVALPIVFLFWVNTHGLWFFGMAFLGLFVFLSILEHLFLPEQGIDKKALVMLVAATGISILALAVNPDGISHPAYIIYSLVIPDPEAMGTRTTIEAFQSLWGHFLYSGRILWTGIAWMSLAMLLIFLGIWVVAWKRSGIADFPVAVPSIAFFLISMSIARLILVYGIIWLAAMVFLAWRMGPKNRAHPKVGPLIMGAFLLLIGISAAKAAFITEDRKWLGFGYQDYIPGKEIAFIMDHNLPGPIFNDYLLGGYMMWAMYPEYKVFLDPRHYPYTEQVYPDYQAIGSTRFPLNNSGLNSFMARYPARIALIQHHNTHLIDWLRKSPDWSLAYFDKNASVLLHKEVGTRLSPEARAVSLGPERFKNVSNPTLLFHLFTYYYLLNPRLAMPIRDYYEQNVSNLYIYKKHVLQEMNQRLAGM